MTALSLLVRDAARSLLGTVSPPWAGVIVGGLAADPETIAELDLALQRFQIDAPLPAWRRSFTELADAAAEVAFTQKPNLWGGIIDLPTRLIFWGGGPGPGTGLSAAPLMDNDSPTPTEIVTRLPATWRVINDWRGWSAQVQAARGRLAETPPLDVREVLYDRLPEWLAQALCDARRHGDTDPVPMIHAAWLSAARDDLGGRTPREVLLADLDAVEEELHRRSSEWSRFGRPPVALPRGSRAHRYGAIGMHEFIMYYDLVRHLLEFAWRTRPGELLDPVLLTEWLAKEQQDWLQRPIHDGAPDAYVPSEVIDLERQRLPCTADPKAAMVDCDCPLCQIMAEENFGPTFVHFDTVHFDPEFVFSPYKHRKDWELDYGTYDEDDMPTSPRAKPDEPANPTNRLADDCDGGDADDDFAAADEPGLTSVTMALDDLRVVQMSRHNSGPLSRRALEASAPRLWANSFIAPTPSSAPRNVRLQSYMFEVAAHSAELRDDVCATPDHLDLMLGVLEDFANLRAAMREKDHARVQRLATKCTDALNRLGTIRRDVAEKCGDLEAAFRRLASTICERADAPAQRGKPQAKPRPKPQPQRRPKHLRRPT